MCFVEMHVVYLQLNGTEKWYKFLCQYCHISWNKCCICKLRTRLVRKLGKQHKQMKQQNSNTASNANAANVATTTIKLKKDKKRYR